MFLIYFAVLHYVWGQSPSLKGIHRQRHFFSQFYRDSFMDIHQWKYMWDQYYSMPQSRHQYRSALSRWTYYGPSPANKNAFLQTKTVNATGRIRDIAVHVPGIVPDDTGIRILAATGGVWALSEKKINASTSEISSVCLSHSIPAKDFTSFAFHPIKKGIILVGTGEPLYACGTGLYRSIDNGTTWESIKMDNQYPCLIHKLFFDKSNPDILHAATSVGYMRSADGGTTWKTTSIVADMTDAVADPAIQGRLYCISGNGALFRSNDNGMHWDTIVTDLPSNQSIHAVLAIDPKSSGTVYVNMVATNQLTLGLFKSVDGGVHFKPCTYKTQKMPDMHWGQGYFNNIVGVSPKNSLHVLAGGGAFLRTSNGFDFDGIDAHHVDQHAIIWDKNGDMYLGNDGGLFVSKDDGLTFSARYNVFPIAQFYNADVYAKNAEYIVGATQDNGTVYRNTNGWFTTQFGDGFNAAISQDDPKSMFTRNANLLLQSWEAGDSWLPLQYCFGSGRLYYERSNALKPSFVNMPLVECGKGPARFVADSQKFIPLSVNVDFPTEVISLAVSNKAVSSDKANIYMSTANPDPNKQIIIRRRNDEVWSFGNKTGLTGVYYKLIPHPYKFDVVYALGLGLQNDKLFKSADAGKTWYTISGNIPDLPLSCLLVHPFNDDYLLIGTAGFGFLTSKDGGKSWSVFNNGAAIGTIVSDLHYETKPSIRDRVSVFAATYGHSILRSEWVLESTVKNAETPVNSITLKVFPTYEQKEYQVMYSHQKTSKVKIFLTDMQGRNLYKIHTGVLTSGWSSFILQMQEYPPGIYFLSAMDSEGGIKTVKFIK